MQVYDIPTLDEFLKTSPLKAVAFKADISEVAKAKLAEAVAARATDAGAVSLKVQYFA